MQRPQKLEARPPLPPPGKARDPPTLGAGIRGAEGAGTPQPVVQDPGDCSGCRGAGL